MTYLKHVYMLKHVLFTFKYIETSNCSPTEDVVMTGAFLDSNHDYEYHSFYCNILSDEVWSTIFSYTHYLESILSPHLAVAVKSRPSFLPPSTMLLLVTNKVRNRVAPDILYEKIRHEFIPVFPIQKYECRAFTSLTVYFISFSYTENSD